MVSSIPPGKAFFLSVGRDRGASCCRRQLRQRLPADKLAAEASCWPDLHLSPFSTVLHQLGSFQGLNLRRSVCQGERLSTHHWT